MSRITVRLAVVAGLAAACGTAQAATLTVTPGPDAQERLGPKARNLNHEVALAGGGRTNQLERWRRAALLDGAPPPAARPHLAAWDDPRESLDARARAYLDVNCAHCHNPAGSASNSGLFLTAEETRPSASASRPWRRGAAPATWRWGLIPAIPSARSSPSAWPPASPA